jgi:uncharacterized RDD family membrane protein YckC
VVPVREASSRVRAAAPPALALRRIAAWAVDWLIVSGYAIVLVPLGLLLVDSGVRLPQLAWNALAFTLLILPVTVWLAGWERGRRGATPGKRLLRLRTSGPGGSGLGWRRALARNALKVALPWELGHTAAFALADPATTTTDPTVVLGIVGGTAACLVAGVWVTSLFVRSGRTPYDLATSTRVRPATP